MTCRDVVEFLMAYLDGELDAGARADFDRHLGECPACVAFVETYERTVRLGRAALAPTDAPAGGVVPEGLVRAIRSVRARTKGRGGEATGSEGP